MEERKSCVVVCGEVNSSETSTPQETQKEKDENPIGNGEKSTMNWEGSDDPSCERTTERWELETEIRHILDQLIINSINEQNNEVVDPCVVASHVDRHVDTTRVKNENNRVVMVENYRLVPYADSDSSVDSDSDSTSSDNESSTSATSSESTDSSDDDEQTNDNKNGRVKSLSGKATKKMTTQGELQLDDLPAIEDLNISAPKNEVCQIGYVHAIVDRLVVVRSIRGTPPLDLETYLFSTQGIYLGQVFEVLGPVIEPYYTLRFNKVEDIRDKGIIEGQAICYVPNKPEMTSFVFVDKLLQEKGSDASWEFNNEPPPKFLEYSDDEEERKNRKIIEAKRLHEDDDQRQCPLKARPVIDCGKKWRNQRNSTHSLPGFRNRRSQIFHFENRNNGFATRPQFPRMPFGGTHPFAYNIFPTVSHRFETSPFLFNPFCQTPPPPPPPPPN